MVVGAILVMVRSSSLTVLFETTIWIMEYLKIICEFALEKSSISNILKLLQLQYIPLAKGFLSVNRDLYLLCFFFVLFSDDSITVVDWQCCVPLATVTKSNLSLA